MPPPPQTPMVHCPPGSCLPQHPLRGHTEAGCPGEPGYHAISSPSLPPLPYLCSWRTPDACTGGGRRYVCLYVCMSEGRELGLEAWFLGGVTGLFRSSIFLLVSFWEDSERPSGLPIWWASGVLWFMRREGGAGAAFFLSPQREAMLCCHASGTHLSLLRSWPGIEGTSQHPSWS